MKVYIRCAWCKEWQGEIPTEQTNNVSHSICDKCQKTMNDEIDNGVPLSESQFKDVINEAREGV